MEKHKIGLTLSGGGYKGIAHAGVISLLLEKGIEPTILSGTSAGSIISCLYAIGMKPEEMLDFFKSINVLNWSFITFRKAGIIDSKAFEKHLQTLFGNKTLADLPVEVRINSTDIINGKIHIFNINTKITDALLASSAFPGVFSPHTVNDTIFSDGGILNNFATDLIRKDCGLLIGSNVCPIETVDVKDIQSIRSLTMRAYFLMTASHSLTHGNLCDWLIEDSHIREYSTFERNKQRMDEMFQLGYNAAANSFNNHKDKFLKAVF